MEERRVASCMRSSTCCFKRMSREELLKALKTHKRTVKFCQTIAHLQISHLFSCFASARQAIQAGFQSFYSAKESVYSVVYSSRMRLRLLDSRFSALPCSALPGLLPNVNPRFLRRQATANWKLPPALARTHSTLLHAFSLYTLLAPSMAESITILRLYDREALGLGFWVARSL